MHTHERRCGHTYLCLCPCAEIRTACLLQTLTVGTSRPRAAVSWSCLRAESIREGSMEAANPTAPQTVETCGETSRGSGALDVFYCDGDPRLPSRWTGPSAQSSSNPFLIILTVTVPVTPEGPFPVLREVLHLSSCSPVLLSANGASGGWHCTCLTDIDADSTEG